MIVIDYKDRRPIYEQIIDKFKMLIVKGVYPPDTPLPSVRSLAMELSINPNTIQRAYQELERMGFIYSVKGKGSFVNGTDTLIVEQQDKMLTDFKEGVKKLKEAGLSQEQLKKAIEECYCMEGKNSD